MRKENYNRFRRYTVTAAFLAAAVLTPITLSGCKKTGTTDVTASSGAVSETESGDESEPQDIRTATLRADGSTQQMIESGGGLYYKYKNTIQTVDKKTGEMRVLRTFSDDEVNQTFWIYGGNLYFDLSVPDDETAGTTPFYGLNRIDLETGEEKHLADLMVQPNYFYASEDKLYIRGFDQGLEVNVVYALNDEGDTAGELGPGETVYGQIPEGCRELFNSMLPYHIDHLGYMPVQNDTNLVIAETDGSNPREVKEITNTSSVLFAEDSFFVPNRDGSGNTGVYRYDVKTLEKTVVFRSTDNPLLIQYRDGYLYYGIDRSMFSSGSNTEIYRIPETGSNPELVAIIRDEPGMIGALAYYGNFYAAEDEAYYQKIKDYSVYIAKTDLQSKEETLLEPELSESGLRSIGRVEAVSGTIPSKDGEIIAAEYYVERLILEGDSEAVAKMNASLDAEYDSILSTANSLGVEDEEWIHQEGYQPVSMSYAFSRLSYQSERYYCIEMEGYEYSGGAHGTPFREYFIFDRETGEQLSLDDIVENTPEELQTMVGRAFRELAEETNFAFETPGDLEHTVADSVSYDSAFYLTEEGIVFYYVPYEIAPFAAGFPEVVIPYQDLKLKITL